MVISLIVFCTVVTGIAGMEQVVGEQSRIFEEGRAAASPGVDLDRRRKLHRHLAGHPIEHLGPPGGPAAQGGGEPGDRTQVADAEHEHSRSGGAEPVDDGLQVAAIALRSHTAQRIVGAHRDRRQVGTEPHRLGELALDHVVRLGPTDGEADQFHVILGGQLAGDAAYPDVVQVDDAWRRHRRVAQGDDPQRGKRRITEATGGILVGEGGEVAAPRRPHDLRRHHGKYRHRNGGDREQGFS